MDIAHAGKDHNSLCEGMAATFSTRGEKTAWLEKDITLSHRDHRYMGGRAASLLGFMLPHAKKNRTVDDLY